MAKKDFGRRLMPEYLLKYSEELHKNHPDPSASWGGGGGDYTAGEGIEISDQDVISIDEEVVAKKTDIPDVSDFVTDTDLNTALADYELKSEAFSGSYDDLTDKPTIPTKTSELQNDSGFITGVSWNDVSGKPTFATVATSGDYDDLLNKPTIPTVDYPVTDVQVDGVSVVSNKVASITMPTVPTKTSDLDNDSDFITSSALSGYATETWVENKGYLTSVSWSDVSGKPTFSTVATSGSYTDLTDKPTIPTKVSDLQNDSGFITSSALSGYATETWVGQQGYLTSVSWTDVSNKPTFATVATTGDYDDLLNKPTIPTVNCNIIQITRTYSEGSWTENWPDQATTALIKANPERYAFIVKTVNEDTIEISFSPLLTATLENPGSPIYYRWEANVADSSNITTCTVTVNIMNQWWYSEATSSYSPYTAGTGISISSGSISVDTTTVALKTDIPSTIAWADVTGKPSFATVATSGSYTDLTDKPSIPSAASSTSTSTSTSTVTPTTETLVFTLDDDSTVTVNVMTGATVATTTTTTTTTTLS